MTRNARPTAIIAISLLQYAFAGIYIAFVGIVLILRGMTLWTLFTDPAVTTSIYKIADVMRVASLGVDKTKGYDNDLIFLTMETLKFMFIVIGLSVAGVFIWQLFRQLNLAKTITCLYAQFQEGKRETRMGLAVIYAKTRRYRAAYRVTFPLVLSALSVAFLLALIKSVYFFQHRSGLLLEVFNGLPQEWRLPGEHVHSLVSGTLLCFLLTMLLTIIAFCLILQCTYVVVCRRIEAIAAETDLSHSHPEADAHLRQNSNI